MSTKNKHHFENHRILATSQRERTLIFYINLKATGRTMRPLYVDTRG